MKEAGWRQRRRWLGVGAAMVVVLAVALLLAFQSGRSTSKPSRNTPRTLPTPPVHAAPACASSDLSVHVGVVQGTAQHWVIPVTFTNVSATRCSVTGYPVMSFLNEAGQAVGLPISEVQGEQSVRPIILQNGESASAFLWEPDTTDLTRAGQPCSPVLWSAIRVTSPANSVVTGAAGAWSSATTTCTTGEAAWIGPLRQP